MKEVIIDFMPTGKSIAEQLEAQGLSMSKKDARRIQKLVDAIHLLDANKILQDTVVFSCTRKVMREVHKAVKPRITGRCL